MAVLINENTEVIRQGITGSQGTFLTEQATAENDLMCSTLKAVKG